MTNLVELSTHKLQTLLLVNTKRVRPESNERTRTRTRKRKKRTKRDIVCCRLVTVELELPYCSKIKIMLTTSLILMFATIATCYSFSVSTTNAHTTRAEPAQPHGSPFVGAAALQPGVNQAASHSYAPKGKSRETSAGFAHRRPRRALISQPASDVRQRHSSHSAGEAPTAPASRMTPQRDPEPSAQQQHTPQTGRAAKDMTAQNGQSVLLHCLVEPNESGELPEVSWFRGSGEPQLLTYETTTIIKDERFLVRRGLTHPNDVALQIRALDKNTDGGLYQCQTSGDAPQLQSYQLNIVEPQVSILDSPDLAVQLGAPINLTCVISQSADELQFVFWYRDTRMINYDLTNEGRGKIVASKMASRPDTISSNLQIFSSRASDSGNYTCAPSGARSTSIYVHVLEATDKGLMMFQNDETNALAAGSHQANSAVSAHVVRLSRGRAYAILAAFLILSTWFQLVAQLQTAISLSLVAIIGLFLSHSSQEHHQAREEDETSRTRQTCHRPTSTIAESERASQWWPP